VSTLTRFVIALTDSHGNAKVPANVGGNPMRIVVALGGNALMRRGEALNMATQARRVRDAANALAPLCTGEQQVVVTHGNGPQVGLLALQAAATRETPVPLDILDAESAGMIGYLLEQALTNVLPANRSV
jgi:carbamate kinase